MKKNTITRLLFCIVVAITFVLCMPNDTIVQATKEKKTYTIGPTSSPCDKSKKFTTYNKYTKQYYLIRSYLEKLEKEGGGTLVLKKGEYSITNVLYVPSNVTIRLKKGVVLKKGNKTGTSKFKPSGTMITLLPPSKQNVKGKITKYNGTKNVKIIGEGNPVIDLNYYKDGNAIILGHNQNVEIKGITFKNMNAGHFIEMDASKNVTISKCTFMNHKDSYSNGKEAINIDTPDKETKGFNVTWSAQDKTPNYNVKIQDCTFKKLERAIGTHKYSQNKLHSKIVITGNKIDGCDNDAIRVMNWRDVSITNNTIKNVGKAGDGKRAILVSGASQITITGNTFQRVSRAMQFIAWKNTGAGEKYKTIYNELTQKEIKAMQKNVIKDVDETFFRINKVYNEYIKDTEKYEITGK